MLTLRRRDKGIFNKIIQCDEAKKRAARHVRYLHCTYLQFTEEIGKPFSAPFVAIRSSCTTSRPSFYVLAAGKCSIKKDEPTEKLAGDFVRAVLLATCRVVASINRITNMTERDFDERTCIMLESRWVSLSSSTCSRSVACTRAH